MSKITISVLLIFCLNSCRNDKLKKNSFDKEHFKEHYIDYIKGTLLLPRSYQEITTENRPYVFSTLDSLFGLRKVISHLDADRVDYVIFSDENNLHEILFILKSEYINFSKRDANQYLGMLEHTLKSNLGSSKYIRVEDKMTTTERSKYIKLKYKIDSGAEAIYQTQYIVTSGISTFCVMEFHNDSLDHEELIKRVNYLVN